MKWVNLAKLVDTVTSGTPSMIGQENGMDNIAFFQNIKLGRHNDQ